MLTDKETELTNEMLALLERFDCVGFAGCFRDKDTGSFITLKMEHPLYQDGKCVRLGKVLELATVDLYGATYTPVFAGAWPAKPGSGEMPT